MPLDYPIACPVLVASALEQSNVVPIILQDVLQSTEYYNRLIQRPCFEDHRIDRRVTEENHGSCWPNSIIATRFVLFPLLSLMTALSRVLEMLHQPYPTKRTFYRCME